MATQSPTPTQPSYNNNIKSTARKLPVKRKTPTQPQIPIHIANPNPISPDPYAADSAIILPNAYDDHDEDEFDDDEEGSFGGGEQTLSSSGNDLKPPPFKFHRIWSESDEIRFLQGLLGCWSQGLVFPRDLNLFYDRFSESMPQPYTRSQLSEKLRRLRRKFRIMSGRIARGQNPNRLTPHDRDLLHLCTRLWDPTYAPTSPFSPPEASAGTVGNKRRRPNPRGPTAARPKVESTTPPPATSERNLEFNSEKEEDVEDAVTEDMPMPAPLATSVADSVGKVEDVGYITAKTVLDVFDGSLKELRMTLKGHGSSGSELSKRLEEQRLMELDVFAHRLRLVLEQSLGRLDS